MEKLPDTTLAGHLITSARARWDCTAIADSGGSSLSYGQTLTQAAGIAGWLFNARPAEPRIGVYLPACISAALINYGITLAGKTAVNLNFTSGQQNCRLAIEKCGLKTILTTRTFLERLSLQASPEMVQLEDLPSADKVPILEPSAPISPDSSACILFSSGSTGVPKGIELTHWNILTNAEGLALRIPPQHDDCMLGVLPFFHSFGYTFALWFPVLHGIRAVYHATPTDAKIIGDLAERHRTTYFISTPSFCQQYVSKIEPQKFSTLKYILVGAEKLRESVARNFTEHFGITLLAGYGCTELGPGVAVNTPREAKPGSVGRPLAGIEVRIAHPETLQPLPIGEEGMILINGPSRMPGYFDSPELTAQAIRDGFYITGDLGYLDADGYLYLTDRLARFSKIGGEMVPHLRIEEAVSELTPSFVTGVPDDRRGERLVLLFTNAERSSRNHLQTIVPLRHPPALDSQAGRHSSRARYPRPPHRQD